MRQTLLIVGIVGVLGVSILVAGMAGVDCLRRLVDSDGTVHTYTVGCDYIAPPIYSTPATGGFFQTIGNIFSFVADGAAWFIALTTSAIALNGYIAAILTLLLLTLIIYSILKLLSLGGG